MLTFDQIKELIDLVGRRRLHSIEIERAGYRVRITGEAGAPLAPGVPAPPPAAPAVAGGAEPPPAAPQAAVAAPAAEPRAVELHVVASPIVGTFYASPSPDAAPFARVGERVRRGQVLCIVEAMKLMNEIECDADGIVAEIYPKNAQPVEYGEPLFGIRRD